MFRRFTLLLGLFLLTFSATAEVVTLDLPGGMRLQGEVVSWDGATLSFQTSGGLLSYRRDQLTPEAVQMLEARQPKAETAALQARVVALESQLQSLQRENESLKRQLRIAQKDEGAAQAVRRSLPAPEVVGSVPVAPVSSVAGIRADGAGASAPVATTSTAGEGYTLSSTGKRHNARCRYYGKGRPCGPSEGTACKVCGG